MTDKSNAPELKPCPFCGTDAYVIPDSEHSTAFILGHTSQGCPIDDLWDWHLDEEKAIAAWNTRADGGTVGKLVEALDKARAALAAVEAPKDLPLDDPHLVAEAKD